jgi:hypothetical protein
LKKGTSIQAPHPSIKSHNYEQEGDLEKALPYIEKSMIIFEMRNNTSYHSYLFKKKEQIMAKREERNSK